MDYCAETQKSNNTILKSKKYDEAVGKIVGTFLVVQMANIVLRNTGIITSKMSIVFFTTFFLARIIYELNYVKKTFPIALYIECAFCGLTIISFILYPEAQDKITIRCLWTMTYCIPLYIFGKYVKDLDLFFRQTISASFIALFLAIFAAIMHYKDPSLYRYSMSLGYALLFPVLSFFSCARAKKLFLIPFLIGLLVILVLGSRGPLLGVGIYFIFLVFEKKSRLFFIKCFYGLGLLVVIIASLQVLFVPFTGVFLGGGIQSRTFSMITEGILFQDSGRFNIFNKFFDALVVSPLWGYGIFAWESEFGYYPHNIFIELIYSFGFLFGGVLSVLLVTKVVLGLFFSDEKAREVVRIVVLSSLPGLLVSGTFLQSPLFWLMMGFTGVKINSFCKI